VIFAGERLEEIPKKEFQEIPETFGPQYGILNMPVAARSEKEPGRHGYKEAPRIKENT
jgi:hypothetical protein